MELKLLTIIEICLFALLLFVYFKVSYSGKVTTFAKWVITLSSIGILAIADKFKLVLWLIVVGLIWLIKYSKKKKNDELA